MQQQKPSTTTDCQLQTVEVEPLLKLKGLPGLSDYLHFNGSRVVNGKSLKQKALVNEWRRANDLYHRLEKQEANIANSIDSFELPKSLEKRKQALLRHKYFKKSFEELPVTVKMVELAKLVASQHSVGVGFANAIASQLGNKPSFAALFDFCLPIDRPSPPIEAQKLGSSHYIFTSPSTDFRDHSLELATAKQLAFISSFGPVDCGLVVPIGFGSNLLSAIESEGRIILQNGYHRAFALLQLGITHAPMIVEKVTRTDELNLTASSELADNPLFYFRSKRPPMLRDFLNPKLAKAVEIYALETRVEVEIKVKMTTTPKARSL